MSNVSYLPPALGRVDTVKALASIKRSSNLALLRFLLPCGRSVLCNGLWAVLELSPLGAAIMAATDCPEPINTPNPKMVEMLARWFAETPAAALTPYAATDCRKWVIASPDGVAPVRLSSGEVMAFAKLGALPYMAAEPERVLLVTAGRVVGVMMTAQRYQVKDGWQDCGASAWPKPSAVKRERKAALSPAEAARAAVVAELRELAQRLPSFSDYRELNRDLLAYVKEASGSSKAGRPSYAEAYAACQRKAATGALVVWQRPSGSTRYRLGYAEAANQLADRLEKMRGNLIK